MKKKESQNIKIWTNYTAFSFLVSHGVTLEGLRPIEQLI